MFFGTSSEPAGARAFVFDVEHVWHRHRKPPEADSSASKQVVFWEVWVRIAFSRGDHFRYSFHHAHGFASRRTRLALFRRGEAAGVFVAPKLMRNVRVEKRCSLVTRYFAWA